MAEQDHEHGTMDIQHHEATFDGFMKWVTWTTVVILAVLIFLAIFAS